MESRINTFLLKEGKRGGGGSGDGGFFLPIDTDFKECK